jgi:hypothetical protein
VFGWKNVHKHDGALVGKRQDKAGRWRLAKVPYYSTNPVLCILNRRPNEAAWTVGPIPERNLQGYSLQKHSLRLGVTRSTLQGGDQSCGTVRPSHSFEQESQATSKIETSSLSQLDLHSIPTASNYCQSSTI